MKLNIETSGVKAVAQGGGNAAELSGHPVEVLIASMGQAGISMYEARSAPGQGTALHTQNGDSSLYVIEGVYQVFAGEKVTVAGPGTAVFVPHGVAHGFTNIGETEARLIGFTSAQALEQKAARTVREEESVPLSMLNQGHGFQLCLDCFDV